MGKLDNQVAIATGCGHGIGRAIALKLASEGASVVVNSLNKRTAEATAVEIEKNGGEAAVCSGNVTEENFPDIFVNTAIESYGRLDIIINNAGYTWDSVIQKTTDEQWYTTLETHLTAPFKILRAAQPFITGNTSKAGLEHREKSCRKVVNVSSISALHGNIGQANYAAAKAGLIGLTKSLAKEWARYNITVNTVAFGLIKTRLTAKQNGLNNALDIEGRKVRVGVNPDRSSEMENMIPLGRFGTPAEAAGAVYLLCIPESNYITGQTLICSGGLSL